MSDEPSKNIGGRPSDFTQDAADTICERLALGESLRAICSEDGMPRMPAVMRWLDKNEGFRNQYARAREIQAEYFFDEAIEIADETDADEAVKVSRAKLRVDTRKWAASKLAPKKYGDKTETTLKGDPDSPVAIAAIVRTVVDPKANGKTE